MSRRLALVVFGLGFAFGCGKDPVSTGQPDGGLTADMLGAGGGDMATGTTGDPQIPPTTGAAALMTWLQAGHYKSWHCEATAHPSGPNGAHGNNRICSNNLLAAAAGVGEYPVGSASVKELYSGTMVVGYAVSVRVQTGPTGNSWFWSEYGSAGTGIPLCANCHQQAGSGGTFTGHDFVFVRVM